MLTLVFRRKVNLEKRRNTRIETYLEINKILGKNIVLTGKIHPETNLISEWIAGNKIHPKTNLISEWIAGNKIHPKTNLFHNALIRVEVEIIENFR